MQNIMCPLTGNEISFPNDIDSIFVVCLALKIELSFPENWHIKFCIYTNLHFYTLTD
jgi:hypothetical protein